MLNPHFRLSAPSGGDLLTELGIDPVTVSELAEDDRAIRCPDRGAAFPERSFASLFPELPPDHGFHEPGHDEPSDPVPASRPAGRRWRRA